MMGRQKQGNVRKDDGKPPPQQQPPPARTDEDDYEDGDMATPKSDRYGSDDEPLE